MKASEEYFQSWVWTGYNDGRFKPDGKLEIDEDGTDIFTGYIFIGDEEMEVSYFGPVLENLPEIIIASLVGRRLEEIIQLPPCGDDELDAKVSAMKIKEISQNENKVTLMIG